MTPPGRQRASGESSIFRDETGRWHGWVSMGTKENGARDRRHVSATRRADVVAKVRALEAKRDAGVVEAAGTSPTVGDWLDHWLDTIAARRVRPRTLESYRAIVRLHLRPGIGHHRLDRLQPEHLERLYAALLDKGLSPATVLRIHRVLSRALRVAMQRGRTSRNVATLVDPPAARRPQTPLPLTLDEARRVLGTASGHRNAARWTVALAVGLRQSEALAPQWADVDLDAGSLTVRRGIHRVAGGGLVYEGSKAERSRPHRRSAHPTGRRPPGAPRRPAGRASRGRLTVGGPRPGLRPAHRSADRPPGRPDGVEGAAARGRRPRRAPA